MRTIDLVIIVAYLAFVALIPVVVAGRQKNKEDFIMAGRRMHWLPLALSGVAVSFSAISLLGAPGFVLANDLKYLPTLFIGILSIPVVFFLVVPFLYKLRLVSVYEYLEDRFCPAIRYAASALFMISKLGYLAMTIFTPALALRRHRVLHHARRHGRGGLERCDAVFCDDRRYLRSGVVLHRR